eukprot:TRINITY_DN7823_c0_g1_i1.p1 TRINITY_DN7823_c0_g1~~TRINITY_DN7823_c0_g1_i1.p1  ORF type:complete len:334 (-),score=19.88 TRINITY_DN7823_c0_g1_i1:139-1104(-)
MCIAYLPLELLDSVFSLLEYDDLCNCYRVCKSWKVQLVGNSSLWNHVFIHKNDNFKLPIECQAKVEYLEIEYFPESEEAKPVEEGECDQKMEDAISNTTPKSCQAYKNFVSVKRLVIYDHGCQETFSLLRLFDIFHNLKWIEIHSSQYIHKDIVSTLITDVKFKNLELFFIGYDNNFYWWHKTDEALDHLVNLYEEKADNSFQKTITLQHLLRKQKKYEEADELIENNSVIPRPEHLKSINERIDNAQCTRGLDRLTCYYWHVCFTCGMTGFIGLCATCAEYCHKGHAVAFKYISSGAYCDCVSHHSHDINDKSVVENDVL